MPEIVDLIVPLHRLTPPQGHFFFGYYDVPAADATGARHLCHEVAFRERFPVPGDVARIGVIPLTDLDSADGPAFEVVAETTAWNFQQGSMLQWLGSDPDTILHNTFVDGRYGACVQNLRSGARRALPLPVANVARDGRSALCINMSRVFDFRPGYGYEELPDPHADIDLPADDGVWLMDVDTGAYRQILSYPQIAECLRADGEYAEGGKLVVNHITFNPSATRFLFLARTFPQPGASWKTYLLTCAADGSDLRNHPCWGMASHYHWRDDDAMLFWMNTCSEGKPALVVVSDATGELTKVDESYFLRDGHCSYSPDGRWILYDSYPDGSTSDYLRSLFVYSVERREGFTLGRFRSERYTAETVDLRCDLHPRWMPDGRSITFDSIHEGYRGMYHLDLSEIVE